MGVSNLNLDVTTQTKLQIYYKQKFIYKCRCTKNNIYIYNIYTSMCSNLFPC